jgi:hypothetical protein
MCGSGFSRDGLQPRFILYSGGVHCLGISLVSRLAKSQSEIGKG